MSFHGGFSIPVCVIFHLTEKQESLDKKQASSKKQVNVIAVKMSANKIIAVVKLKYLV